MDGGLTRFGQVEFDAARGTLSRAGQRVRLDRPCAAILSVLLGEAGKDVDKDHLLEAGWPGRVVHENSLAKAIGRLRQALGEDGALLETVHGFGCRLTADPVPVARPEPTRRGWFRRAALLVGIVGLAVVSLAVLDETGRSDAPGLLRGEPDDALGRVLWVDDHPENNSEERRFLERSKIAVYQVATGEEALALLAMYEYRAVISDMNRHDRPLAGLELVREMRRRNDATPFVLYTVVPSDAQRSLLAQAGGQQAAVTPEELYAAILPLVGENGKPGRP